MNFYRGQIIEIAFPLPPDTNKQNNHPAVVISDDDLHSVEDFALCAMITHSKREDKFTFSLNKDMFIEGHDGKYSEVRCHIITYVLPKHIIPNKHRSSLKPKTVEKIIARIKEATFKI